MNAERDIKEDYSLFDCLFVSFVYRRSAHVLMGDRVKTAINRLAKTQSLTAEQGKANRDTKILSNGELENGERERRIRERRIGAFPRVQASSSGLPSPRR